PRDMTWLREPLASRLRHMAQRLPDLRLLLSQRFASLDQLASVRFGARSHGTQWLALVALSVVLIAILEALKLPGGIMIGAMLAAIVGYPPAPAVELLGCERRRRSRKTPWSR